MVNDLACIWFTNKVLDGKFYTLGLDYIMADRTPEGFPIDAMDHKFTRAETFERIFPLRASCNVNIKGTGGGRELYAFVCVLAPNVLSRYVFLTLWFWYGALVILNTISIVKAMLLGVGRLRASYLIRATGSTKVDV